MTEFIFPVNIVDSAKVTDINNLLLEQTLQIGLSENTTAKVRKNGYIILDFGKEMCGGVRILTLFANGTKVRVRFGESLSECCSELAGKKNSTNDHATRDFFCELQNYSDMTFGGSGFRFVRLDFSQSAEIKSIIAVNNILSLPTVYTYSGDDDLVKEIYDTAKRTVDLCASSGYVWDGVKRDRLVWIGDMHPEMLALTTLYGRCVCIERSLDFAKSQAPLPQWMNGYPMYSLWWIIILCDYFEKTGARDYIEAQLQYLDSLLSQVLSCIKENGELDYPAYFVDWPTHETPDEIHGVRAINIIAAKKAKTILKAFEKSTDVAEEILQRLLKIEIAPKNSKQVLGLKYFATELTADDKNMLVSGGAKGMSTFMSYYILEAVASFDEAAAIDMMKEYYGAMLKKGATTFWEDFNVDWAEGSSSIDRFPRKGEKDIHGDFGAFCYKGFRHSLCHGWSAGVLQFIKDHCK